MDGTLSNVFVRVLTFIAQRGIKLDKHPTEDAGESYLTSDRFEKTGIEANLQPDQVGYEIGIRLLWRSEQGEHLHWVQMSYDSQTRTWFARLALVAGAADLSKARDFGAKNKLLDPRYDMSSVDAFKLLAVMCKYHLEMVAQPSPTVTN